MEKHPLAGVYAAAVTPLKPDNTIDLEAIPALLDFLAVRGCHGALLLGTTGEGPSFAVEERRAIWQHAVKVREQHSEFRLLAGTGSPSLDETIQLTKIAFDLGFDGVVTLPPYYFRTASEAGLLAWFSEVMQRAVPEDGMLLGYHFPQVSGVGLSLELLKRLRNAFPDKFSGIKDSSGDLDHGKLAAKTLGPEFAVLVGNDRIFSQALEGGAAGAITALANLYSEDLREIWDAFQVGEARPENQAQLDAGREILERYPPPAALLKALLAGIHNMPRWAVRAPLMPLDEGLEKQALAAMMPGSTR
ncbi:MAG: dihydrodipicolinate synthase family protein [Anaerolineae bacterium]|nr:dihydrodipicolinate synthase family protein [Anaerolineae bacterium]